MTTNALHTNGSTSVAPYWHTGALVALQLSVAALGTLLHGTGTSTDALQRPSGRIVAVYLPLVVVQWSLVFYVCRVGRPRGVLGSLLGARWTTWTRASVDLALALCAWLFVLAMELAWNRLTTVGTPASVLAMLPHTTAECVGWVVVSVSVGFCEEVVFRGYLQTQFEAFWGRASVAVVLQAVLFGIAHGEQGALAMARVALHGVAFGVLARSRGSLLPGIACHVWTDLASGLLRA